MRKKIQILVSILLLTLVVSAATSSATIQADEGDLSHTGILASRPEGTEGTWVIGDLSFEADINTEINTQQGPLVEGVCAEVYYVVEGGANLATKIESKAQEGDCSGEGDGEGEHMEVYGYVDSFPAELIGEWVVEGVAYTADANTDFEEEDGPFAVGVCVEVDYLPDNNLALKIETEHDYKCEGNGPGEDDGPHSEVTGILESFPEVLVGEWVVNGTIYTADTETEFEQEHGPFFIGACVEVKYLPENNYALEISTQEFDDCNGPGDGPSHQFFGFIEVVPDGLIGTWIIGGTEFEATAETEFEQDDGPFEPGICAKVRYFEEGTLNIAREIETKSPTHCLGDTSTNEAYGLVDSLPDSLYGTWIIDGAAYEATLGVTELEEEHGPFAEGACVKVKYFTHEGINQAVEIETEEMEDCHGDELPGNSKLYATIDDFPPTPYFGDWIISLENFTATSDSEFEQEHGPFEVGACAEAEYVVTDSGRLLHEVETKSEHKCQDDSGNPLFKAYGAIEMLPDHPDLLGTWTIGGINYEVGLDTVLSEEHGLFAIGAFVEARFVNSGAMHMAIEIETHVAPGAGRSNIAGVLDAHDSTDDWNDWVVDGVTYKADPAIDVGAGDQAPQVGKLVALNTFEQQGDQFVTFVTGLSEQVFLPLMDR